MVLSQLFPNSLKLTLMVSGVIFAIGKTLSKILLYLLSLAGIPKVTTWLLPQSDVKMKRVCTHA